MQLDNKAKNTHDFSHGMVRYELSEFKPVEMEVTKSAKQESHHFSDERFKTKSHTAKNVKQIFWEYLS